MPKISIMKKNKMASSIEGRAEGRNPDGEKTTWSIPLEGPGMASIGNKMFYHVILVGGLNMFQLQHI